MRTKLKEGRKGEKWRREWADERGRGKMERYRGKMVGGVGVCGKGGMRNRMDQL